MKKELLTKCAIACKEVYESNIDLGTTEFNLNLVYENGITHQILSIAGTNEKKDWLKNINLSSKKGIKRPAFDAAGEIMASKAFNKNRIVDIPLIVTGHSKAGATAIAFHKLYHDRMIGSSYCVAFAPARCLRYWINRKMKNTFIFTDPDDPVSFVGRISFGLPKAVHYKADNNYFGFKVDDHKIEHWIRYCQNMQ